MTLEEIKALEPKEMIEELKKGRLTDLPVLADINKSIDVNEHPIFDETLRLDKMIVQDDGSTKKESVARIGLGLQKLIVKRAVAFLFGNPVKYINEDENSDDVFIMFKDILKDAKINSFNRKIARDIFSTKEVAELWYPVPFTEEGSDEKFKLKVKKLSVLTGDDLYPYFDEFGDMIVFSRKYEVDKVKFFEVYTADIIYRYNTTDEVKIVDGFPKQNVFKKIPIVYGIQQETSFNDVEGLIDRLEKVLSNFADTNDYHAAPKLFVKGTIKGFSKKGESGAIIEGDANTTVQYLSWAHAPESVKMEIANLKEMIYTISQTPDISFESIKSLGGNAVSGKALKFMFLDAHLKVMDNMEVFDEYLQRRTSIVKAFMTQVRTELKAKVIELDIEAIVTPYMLDDISDKLDFIMTANGNKPVISTRTAIRMSGLVENVEAEVTEIQNEEAVSVLEPTGL